MSALAVALRDRSRALTFADPSRTPLSTLALLPRGRTAASANAEAFAAQLARNAEAYLYDQHYRPPGVPPSPTTRHEGTPR